MGNCLCDTAPDILRSQNPDPDSVRIPSGFVRISSGFRRIPSGFQIRIRFYPDFKILEYVKHCKPHARFTIFDINTRIRISKSGSGFSKIRIRIPASVGHPVYRCRENSPLDRRIQGAIPIIIPPNQNRSHTSGTYDCSKDSDVGELNKRTARLGNRLRMVE